MSRINEHIDEHILAAFLTGDLPPSLRKEIAAYIAHNERARDLVSMATDAMEVVESGDGSPRPPMRTRRSRTNGVTLLSSELADHDTRLWKIAALFAISVLVLSITVGLFAYEFRSTTNQTPAHTWAPAIGSGQLSLRWPAQPDAATYEVMVQNQRSGISALVSRTEGLSVEVPSDAIEFQGNTAYQIWVLSLDADRHVLSRSQPLAIFN